tara:strand:+ start:72 stop:917 length:846 start_codon:yes stop_codon:yes gene_type:complete
MKYFVIDNFINKELCKKLIDDSNSSSANKNDLLMHGNRAFLSSTSYEFNELLNNSLDWQKLESKINSEEFLNLCLEKLNIKEHKFSLENYFKLKNHSRIHKLYKKISNTTNKFVPTKTLLKYTFIRLYREIERRIKFSRFFYPNKKPVELLYDFSKAGNGYSREIHRDSDNRVLVFLIYFNTPLTNDNQQGGNFDIYKLIDDKKNVSKPDPSSCEMIKSIIPEAGKLVVFLNENNSFHGVTEMKNYSDFRYFVYGSFTMLSQKNPHITNKSKSATEFHIYE